jgi:hypothetical protein
MDKVKVKVRVKVMDKVKDKVKVRVMDKVKVRVKVMDKVKDKVILKILESSFLSLHLSHQALLYANSQTKKFRDINPILNLEGEVPYHQTFRIFYF